MADSDLTPGSPRPSLLASVERYAVAVAMDADGGPVVFCSSACEVTWRGSTAGNLF